MISIDLIRKELAALERRLTARMEQAFLVEDKQISKRRRTKPPPSSDSLVDSLVDSLAASEPSKSQSNNRKRKRQKQSLGERLAQDPTWALFGALLLLNCNMVSPKRKRIGPILFFTGPVRKFKRCDSLLVTYWPVMKGHIAWLMESLHKVNPLPSLDLPAIFSESVPELDSAKDHILNTHRIKQVKAMWGGNIDSTQLVAVPIKQCLAECLALVRQSDSFAVLDRQIPQNRSWLEKQPLVGDKKRIDQEFVAGFEKLVECDAFSGLGQFWQLAEDEKEEEAEKEDESDYSLGSDADGDDDADADAHADADRDADADADVDQGKV